MSEIRYIKPSGMIRMKERLGSKFKTYRVWSGMRRRCLDKNHKSYERYGGRGITVCDRWSTLEAFIEDMGLVPEGMTLGRIDNNAGYSPSNCRWETMAAQAKNKRSTRFITVDGIVMCFSDCEKHFGMPRGKMYALTKRMSPEAALAYARKEGGK